MLNSPGYNPCSPRPTPICSQQPAPLPLLGKFDRLCRRFSFAAFFADSDSSRGCHTALCGLIGAVRETQGGDVSSAVRAEGVPEAAQR